MLRCFNLIALACLCSCLSSSVRAQESTTRADDKNQSTNTPLLTKIISPLENDRRITQWIILDVQGIVDCSKEAVDRSNNESVKQFAKTMMSEHKDCISKLEQLGSREDPAGKSERNPPVTRIEDAKINPAKSGVLAKDEAGQLRDRKWLYRPTDFVEVKKDICERMKALMLKEMKQLSSSEFDAMYMKHMVFGHEALLASCQATRSTASSELQAQLDQNIEKLNAHLKQARDLCKQVSSTTAQR